MRNLYGLRGRWKNLVRRSMQHWPMIYPSHELVTSVSDIIIPYHRSLNSHMEIVDALRSHFASFQESREAIDRWIAQPWLQEEGWEAKWEDICSVEVERWEKA